MKWGRPYNIPGDRRQNGVALHLPPHSKTLLVNMAVHLKRAEIQLHGRLAQRRLPANL
jgi:hypothetical protein